MNPTRLKGRMVEKGITQEQLAGYLGLTPTTMSRKVRGISEFGCDEATKIADILGMDKVDRADIFLSSITQN